jgi:hypothetical protein
MPGVSGRIWGIAFEAIAANTCLFFPDELVREFNTLDLVSQEATLALQWTICIVDSLTICKWCGGEELR